MAVTAGYININLLSLAQYRADLVIGIVSTIFLQGIGILSIQVVMGHVKTINGWRFEQVLFMYALAMLIRSLWHVFFMGFLTLTWYVRNGRLDRLMIRPLSVIFQLCNDELDDDGWGETILGFSLLIIAWQKLQIPFSIGNILIMGTVLVSGTLIYNSLTLAGSTLAFWTVQNAPFMDLIDNLSEFTKYPLDVYGKLLQSLFTFLLPVGFISFYPAQYFFNNQQYLVYAYLTPIVALTVSYIAWLFWSYGLNHYQSTGN
jgi:ABC-2 type transport system permease protein